jgi:hypothetical protein
MVVGKMRGSSEFQRLLDRERSPFASMVERTMMVSFPQNLSAGCGEKDSEVLPKLWKERSDAIMSESSEVGRFLIAHSLGAGW